MKILRIAMMVILGMALSACTLRSSRTPVEPSRATSGFLPTAPFISESAPPSTTTLKPTAARSPEAFHPTATTIAPRLPDVQFARLQRIDGQHGWALTWNDWLLLRTADGGATWQVINPPDLAVTNFTALDAERAWVLELNPDPQGPTDVLHRTADGGQNWQAFETPFHSGALQMLDAARGWAFSSSLGCAAGTCFFEPYRTTDGGATWTPVTVENPLNPGLESFYPGMVEIPSGMALTASGWDQLWLSGVSLSGTHRGQEAWFFASQDAGASWMEQRVTMPPASLAPAIPPHVSAPEFVGLQTGCFWAWYQPAEGSPPGLYTFFCTENGGETWSARQGQVAAEYYTAPVDLVSMQVIFTRCLEALCASRDGARSWERVKSNLNFVLDRYPSLADFDFIDEARGWAIVYTSEMDSALYATEDGGQTWKLLPARIEGAP